MAVEVTVNAAPGSTVARYSAETSVDTDPPAQGDDLGDFESNGTVGDDPLVFDTWVLAGCNSTEHLGIEVGGELGSVSLSCEGCASL